MKHFSKSLLAVALLAATTGAANASIAVGSNTLSEAYLSVYDSSQGLTFTLDLGLTFGDLVLNKSNDTFSKSYDLAALTAGSTGGKWSTFAANLNAATTVYGVVASGTAGKLFATGPEISPAKFAVLNDATTAVTATKNHIATVNTASIADNAGAAVSTALNLSAIISDADTEDTGQHNQQGPFSTLNGAKSDAAADISYGLAGNFYYYEGAKVPFLTAQQWTLAGNTLTYATPAAVPLPAAVWMFGAGLMGVLGLTRRKNAAV
ncbi:MAG: VPLPA-CTERM sorting domain-containing protein [Methylococcaceae bacterium]|nr:VPLPA-CTERM sorting domain-containing protein [Methylococcaceae bacterium]MDZ4155461.1 VPLPA-CTERM sorting domain-containing protein [Methylococcales bacterium]MDP2392146.1 VPLPA-CTERM sorting domain-containing protein [Methylococcaceae bacterium]MDP3019418.1 VPLPA-CTERM sorting domain-containing protein [Methylococcaceae bacterium]MDP3390672.1 VPLPA-CTERM sorting domain-containing protein [Methylococcaceae bacterium]